MSLIDILILIGVILVVSIAIIFIIRNKDNNCSGCSSKKNCHDKCDKIEDMKKFYQEEKAKENNNSKEI